MFESESENVPTLTTAFKTRKAHDKTFTQWKCCDSENDEDDGDGDGDGNGDGGDGDGDTDDDYGTYVLQDTSYWCCLLMYRLCRPRTNT